MVIGKNDGYLKNSYHSTSRKYIKSDIWYCSNSAHFYSRKILLSWLKKKEAVLQINKSHMASMTSYFTFYTKTYLKKSTMTFKNDKNMRKISKVFNLMHCRFSLYSKRAENGHMLHSVLSCFCSFIAFQIQATFWKACRVVM